MKSRFLELTLLLSLGLWVTSCHQKLKDDTSTLGYRVTHLEQWQNSINSNLEALQTLTSATTFSNDNGLTQYIFNDKYFS